MMYRKWLGTKGCQVAKKRFLQFIKIWSDLLNDRWICLTKAFQLVILIRDGHQRRLVWVRVRFCSVWYDVIGSATRCSRIDKIYPPGYELFWLFPIAVQPVDDLHLWRKLLEAEMKAILEKSKCVVKYTLFCCTDLGIKVMNVWFMALKLFKLVDEPAKVNSLVNWM